MLQLGRLHPDEVYQYLEPAFFRVRGYGIVAWEWRSGLRNWAFPLVLSGLIRICDSVHVADPQAMRAVLALPQLLLHGWALTAAYRWLRRHQPEGAAFATLALGAQAIVLAYAGRTLGESLSVDFFWIAIEALDRTEDRWGGLLGGAALGLSVVARYPSGAAVVGALIFFGVLGVERQGRRLGWILLGGTLIALGLGVLDWITWGAPFHSFGAYLQFNVFSSEAARHFGAEPASFYGVPLLFSVPAWAWMGLAIEARFKGRAWLLPISMAAAYALALLVAAHKEPRFLYPLAELLALAGALGVARAWSRWSAIGKRAGLATGVLAASALTWAAVPDVRGDQFRAIVRAMRAPSATGLLIVNEGVWGAGGYFYIGKRVPWTVADYPADPSFQQAIRDPRVNRAVTFEQRALKELQAAGFRVVPGDIARETILER